MQKTGWLALASLLLTATLSAVEPIAVHRAEGPIAVDGDLGDAGWRNAATIDTFYETSPADNQPPSVKTVAYLAYDDRAFYIGVHAFDPDPSKIRAPFVDRDQVIGTDDNIAVFLDTRNDRRSAIELRVNPRGIQGDAVYNDANQNEDFSPDFFYDTAAKIGSDGWTAEFRIPFSSLRYSHADPQTWGILIWRNYPRDFRYFIHSAPVPRGSNCLVCRAHAITGLTGLPAAGHLVAAPYVTLQGLQHPENDEPGQPFETDPLKARTGIDVKYNPTADKTLDITVNPDFSQIESDVAQITTNQRFAIFFAEKRPFFLEGSDLFATPLQVAYTRTITAPRWGVRTTGKLGATAYTLLVAQDQGGGLVILPGPTGSGFALQDAKSLSAIGRLRRDYGASFIGAIVTDRENRGGGHNRLLGPDFQWRPNDIDAVTGQLLVSDTADRARPEWNETSHAFNASWNRQAQGYDTLIDVKDIGDRFRADLGFLPQVGYREIDGHVAKRFYPEGLLSFVRANVDVDYQTDRNDDVIFRQLLLGTNFFGFKNLQGVFSIRPQEQVRVGGRLLEQTYATYFAQIDPNRRFTRIVVQGRLGDSIDFENQRVGRGAVIGVSGIVRPTVRLEFALDTNREWLDARGSRVFLAQVERLRTTYSFSAKSLLRVIGQYVSTTRDPAQYLRAVDRHEGNFTGSILYSYKINWQTVLFAGYGDDRVLSADNQLLPADRSLFVKVSYAIQR